MSDPGSTTESAISGEVNRAGDRDAQGADDSATMSGFEALMWDLERDPKLGSAFANLSIFDRPPDRDRLRHRMTTAVTAVPRLRQRVTENRNPFDRPRWVDDPDFDLDHHLRWVDLGGKATMAELHQVAASLIGVPFDRERPLWEFVTIEGLQGGRAAMLQRLHHTITDGKGGIRLSLQFVDFEPDPPLRLIPGGADVADDPDHTDTTGDPVAAGSGAQPTGADTSAAEEDDGCKARGVQVLEGIGRTLGGASSGTLRAIGAAASGVAAAPGTVGDLASLARSTARQAMVGRSRSPLWTERSLDRWFGTTVVSLDDVRNAAHELGGSVNDFFVTGAATAAARYHARLDAPIDQLRVSMPVSTRHDRNVGGNAFSPTQVLVPTSPELSLSDRFEGVSTALGAAKAERVVSAMEHAADAAAMLPSVVVVRAGQYLTGSVDFVCSNVRAAPFDLFIAGAHMEANYPMGPLAGTAFNLTTMSYRGWLFIGLLADPAALEDPQALLDDLNQAYKELLATGGVKRPRRWRESARR